MSILIYNIVFELPVTTVISIFILDKGAWVTLMGGKSLKISLINHIHYFIYFLFILFIKERSSRVDG